ncbi:MAG: PilZ domain-containing protein [Deferrisomatales bacterium]
MERRRGRRKRVRIRVHLEPGGVTSMTGDVSPGGVFLYSARVHRPGSSVRLLLHLPDGREGEAEGVVAWARRVPPEFLSHVRGGMGVQFTWLSPELSAYFGLPGRAEKPAA